MHSAEMIHSLGNDTLLQQYRRAGFAGHVGWGERPALLVIDMAGAWTKPAEELGSDLAQVTEAIKTLLAVVRRRQDIPVVFTTMAYDASFADLPMVTRLKTPHSEKMIRGSERVRLIAELDRRAHEAIVEKPRASAFFNTNLFSILVSKKVDTVIVTGCSTSGCIRSTCESALDYGLHAIVPEEAVGDRSATAHAANLFDINARYADVLPLADVLAHLETTATGRAA